MGFTTDFFDDILDFMAGEAGYASLHSDDPGTTGANELAGGSPAYARKAVTWLASAAADLSLDTTAKPVFDIPAGSSVAYVGFWDSVSAGVFKGAFAVTPEVFASQGTYTLDDIDFTADDA